MNLQFYASEQSRVTCYVRFDVSNQNSCEIIKVIDSAVFLHGYANMEMSHLTNNNMPNIEDRLPSPTMPQINQPDSGMPNIDKAREETPMEVDSEDSPPLKFYGIFPKSRIWNHDSEDLVSTSRGL